MAAVFLYWFGFESLLLTSRATANTSALVITRNFRSIVLIVSAVVPQLTAKPNHWDIRIPIKGAVVSKLLLYECLKIPLLCHQVRNSKNSPYSIVPQSLSNVIPVIFFSIRIRNIYVSAITTSTFVVTT